MKKSLLILSMIGISIAYAQNSGFHPIVGHGPVQYRPMPGSGTNYVICQKDKYSFEVVPMHTGTFGQSYCSSGYKAIGTVTHLGNAK